MARGAPELDPRRAHEDNLPTHGKHVLIFNTAERARAEAGARDNRVDLLFACAARRKRVRAALGDLLEVLYGAAHDSTALREEAREQVVAVRRRVDRERRELDAELGVGDE